MIRGIRVLLLFLTCSILALFLKEVRAEAKSDIRTMVYEKSIVGVLKKGSVEENKELRLNRTEVIKVVNSSFNLNLIGVSDKKVIWKSSNKKVAAVSEDGFVTCLKQGSAIITASYKDKIYQCELVVRKPYITVAEKKCEIGDSFYVKLKGTAAKEYMVEDETVVRVNAKGKVKSKRAGSTVLTIIGENGKKYKCRINVYDTKRRADSITIKSNSSKETSKIKTDDVPKESFSVKPGILVNFTNIIYKSGTPDGLIYLKNSDVTKRLSYRDSDCRLQKEIIRPLSAMIEAAYEDGKYKFSIISGGGYRSYSTQDGYWQRRLKNTPSYGDDPYHNGVKCVPGVSSEHRTGYAIDFDTSSSGFKWLEKNSYKYGFIKRYYGEKTIYTGVMDEYWHFTYVGKEIAATCYYEGICLEEYYQKYVDGDLSEKESGN